MYLRVLFSPIGTTDPIRDDFDGPMLHIARHYRPDSIWLFLSAEMVERDKKDNRYEKSILKILPNCDIRKIKHPEITNPADFDAYLVAFPEIIGDIKAEYGEDTEILVNVSSGTPQMSASACLEVLNDDILLHPIQVHTPAKKSNIDIHYVNDFSDFESVWENNLDNLEDAENRCIEPPILNFKLTKIKSQIISLVNNYEYRAALELSNLYKKYFSQRLIKLLTHASLRIAFRFKDAEKYISKEEKEFFPIVTSPLYDLYEALCIMKVLQDKGDISNLVVKISPFLTKLAEEYITQYLKYRNFSKLYTAYNDGGDERKRFIRNKIAKVESGLLRYLDQCYGEFKDSDMAFSNLVRIIEYHVYNYEDKNTDKYKSLFSHLSYFQSLREIERLIRNPLAHRLEAFDDEDIKKICKDSDEIKGKINSSYDIINAMDWLLSKYILTES